MSKKMNLGNLKTLDSKKFTKRKIIIDNYELEIDEYFRNTKIVSLLQEFMKQTNYAKEKDMEIDSLTYITVLILKYFTTIEVSDKYEEQIQLLSILTDLERDGETYLNVILSAFDENEINKLNKRIVEYSENLTELINNLNKQKDDEEVQEEALEVAQTE